MLQCAVAVNLCHWRKVTDSSIDSKQNDGSFRHVLHLQDSVRLQSVKKLWCTESDRWQCTNSLRGGELM